MINKVLEYLKIKAVNGILLSKYDNFGNIIEDYKFDPTYIFSEFTGSNSTILITADKRLLFTDLRYAQRAENESNFHIIYENPYVWMKNNLLGMNIAIDPMKHRYNDIKIIEHLISSDLDLYTILGIPQITYNEKIVQITSNKLQELESFLSHHKCDTAILIPENYSWVSGQRDLNTKYNKTLSRYGLYNNSHINEYSSENIQKMLYEINNLKNKSILINKNFTPYYIVKNIENNNSIVNESLFRIQAIKSKEECKLLEIANRYETDNFKNIIEWVVSLIKTGKIITEADVAYKMLEIKSKNKDFISESFKTIVAAQKNAAVIHYDYEQNPAILKPNDILLIDSGSHYYCGTTDITRTICLGNPTEKQKVIYTAILNGLLAVEKQIFPKNTKVSALDAISRQFVWNTGNNYEHSTGHGIGFVSNVHEPGYGINNSNTTLEPGMLVSCEPGCYLKNEFGIRLEDDLLVTEIDKNFLKLKKLGNLECDNCYL